MLDLTAIFIDDGGVMNDNVLRAPEWQRLVGEYFAPRLGGSTHAWRKANRTVFAQLESILIVGHGQQDYISWFDSYQVQWLKKMAALVGVHVPSGNDECLKMVWDSVDYITRRVKSTFPGAIEVIKLLHTNGFALFTASGEHSRELDGYLKCMGIHHCFNTAYGADIINCGKYSIEFYRRIFKHSHIITSEALVVDDKPEYLAWAAAFGVKTCLVSANPSPDTKTDIVIPELAELPDALDKHHVD